MRRLWRPCAAGVRRPPRSLLLSCCLPPPPAHVFPQMPPASPSSYFRFMLPVSSFLPAIPLCVFSSSFCTSVLRLVLLFFSFFPFFSRWASCSPTPVTDTLVRNSADIIGRSSAIHLADGFVTEASEQVLLLCQADRLLAGWLGTTPCDMWHHLVCKNDQFLFSFTYVLGSCVFEGYDIIAHIVVHSLANHSGKEENHVRIRSTAATASFLRILNGPGEFCNKIIRVWRIAPKWSSRGMEAMVVALWSIYLFFCLSSKCVLPANVVLTMVLCLQNLVVVLFVLSSHLILRLLVFTVFEWTVWEGGKNRRGNVWSGLLGSGLGDKRDCCVEEDTVGARRWRCS